MADSTRMHNAMEALKISDNQNVGLHAALHAHQANAHKGLQIATPSLLGIPVEIRNMVYRHLLLVTKVRKQTINPEFDNEPYPERPYFAMGRPPTLLEGVSIWNVEYDLETALLFVNRTVHSEASSTLNENNDWVSVTVNVPNFSAHLRGAGFKILTSRSTDVTSSPTFKNAALRVEVSYRLSSHGRDHFLCSSVDLPGLCRALSLTYGYATAKLKLTLSPCKKGVTLQYQEEREWKLLGPFTELPRRPRDLKVAGAESARVTQWRLKIDPTVDEKVLELISNYRNESNTALQQGSWKLAQDKAYSCLGIIEAFIKCDPKIPEHTRFKKCREILGNIPGDCVSNIVLVRLKLGDTQGALKKSEQIRLDELPTSSEFDTCLRQAMLCVALRQTERAMNRFKAAYVRSPSDPQLMEELEAFERRLESGHYKDKVIHRQQVRRLLGRPPPDPFSPEGFAYREFIP